MLFKECFGMAVNALLANKLRSLLTMLGIIIGVDAVKIGRATSELQSHYDLVCRLLLEKKKP